MSATPATRPSLLVRIRDVENRSDWETFVEIYTPLVWGACRRHGLQDADAADVTQDVMLSVASGIRRFEYDPQRGSFRGWMAAVTRNKVNNFLAARCRRPVSVSDSCVEQLAGEAASAAEDAEWDHDYRRRVFDWAAEHVRAEVGASTWEAFRLTAIEGAPGAEAAEQLHVSIGTVYVAKSRVLARLRSLIADVSDESTLPDHLQS